jgi:uncharacterized protein
MEKNGPDLKQVENTVTSLFAAHQDILAVFLLGSAVAGNFRSDSDIDLAILPEGGKRINVSDRLALSNALSYKFSRPVDLGQITSENLVFAREALLKGRPVFLRDPDRVNLIRANLLGMYIQFNLDRKEVVDAYTTG